MMTIQVTITTQMTQKMNMRAMMKMDTMTILGMITTQKTTKVSMMAMMKMNTMTILGMMTTQMMMRNKRLKKMTLQTEPQPLLRTQLRLSFLTKIGTLWSYS